VSEPEAPEEMEEMEEMEEEYTESAKAALALAEKACEEHGFITTVVSAVVDRGGGEYAVECVCSGASSTTMMIYQARALAILAENLKSQAMAKGLEELRQMADSPMEATVQGGFKKGAPP
jgi:hypothetical protein